MFSLNDKESLRYSQNMTEGQGKYHKGDWRNLRDFAHANIFYLTWILTQKINTNKNKRKSFFDHYGNNKCHCLTGAKLLIPRTIA